MTLNNVTIGDTYTDRKNRECTVVDFYTTTNLKGEIVSTKCMVEYNFASQVIRIDVPFATVVRSLIK